MSHASVNSRRSLGPDTCKALLLPNWIAGPSGLVGFGILFFLRVHLEEELMIETFGEDYRRYMARTSRILPGIY